MRITCYTRRYRCLMPQMSSFGSTTKSKETPYEGNNPLAWCLTHSLPDTPSNSLLGDIIQDDNGRRFFSIVNKIYTSQMSESLFVLRRIIFLIVARIQTVDMRTSWCNRDQGSLLLDLTQPQFNSSFPFLLLVLSRRFLCFQTITHAPTPHNAIPPTQPTMIPMTAPSDSSVDPVPTARPPAPEPSIGTGVSCPLAVKVEAYIGGLEFITVVVYVTRLVSTEVVTVVVIIDGAVLKTMPGDR